MNRRDFAKAGAAAGASIPLMREGILARPRQKRRQIASRPPTVALTSFVHPFAIPPAPPSASSYTISLNQPQRDMSATWLFVWDRRYAGPTFEVRKGSPINVRWTNKLPSGQFLPDDDTRGRAYRFLLAEREKHKRKR